jgi:hypothetical protein
MVPALTAVDGSSTGIVGDPGDYGARKSLRLFVRMRIALRSYVGCSRRGTVSPDERHATSSHGKCFQRQCQCAPVTVTQGVLDGLQGDGNHCVRCLGTSFWDVT